MIDSAIVVKKQVRPEGRVEGNSERNLPKDLGWERIHWPRRRRLVVTHALAGHTSQRTRENRSRMT